MKPNERAAMAAYLQSFDTSEDDLQPAPRVAGQSIALRESVRFADRTFPAHWQGVVVNAPRIDGCAVVLLNGDMKPRAIRNTQIKRIPQAVP